MLVCVSQKTGRGVTANMLDLGSSDSGFESQRPDKKPVISKRFTRTIEDFTCGHCGREVRGDGYTNHCPACLWSRHVDKNPGDRAEGCGGMMEPVTGEKSGKEFMIVHKCAICGFVRRNRLGGGDDFDAFVALSKRALT